jgi:hypothetical protein
VNGRGHVNVPVDITSNAAHASVDLLGGWSVREAAVVGAQATVRFRRGAVGGQVLAVLELAANAAETVVLATPIDGDGTNGVYVEVVAGTVEGVLYHRT